MYSTYTGVDFDFRNPTADQVDISDIGHSLSMQCRFNGHCSDFYSVAEHSCLVARILESMKQPKVVVFEGLLHDAAEAYLTDIPSPIKEVLINYPVYEREVDRTIRKKYGLPETMTPIVKTADCIALATEKRDIIPADHDWGLIQEPADFSIDCLSPKEAKIIFLNMFDKLIS